MKVSISDLKKRSHLRMGYREVLFLIHLQKGGGFDR